MATARSAHGTKLKIGDGASPEVFTEIPLADTIICDWPDAKTIPIPDQSNASGFRVSVVSPVKEGGKVTTTIRYDPTNSVHQRLVTKHATAWNFQVVSPGTSTETRTFPAKASLKDTLNENAEWVTAVELEIIGEVVKT